MTTDTCQALVVRVPNGTGSQKLGKETVPIPEPESHQAVVKIAYVAQNPTDIQSLDGNAFGDGAILGCDFAGTVVSTGSNVTRLKEGDVVAGLIWGGEIKGRGSYSEYTVADENICFRVPKGYPLEKAATIPLASATAWLAFFSNESLDIPREKGKRTVLIWGGSSSVGIYAVQLAKLQGWTVATTCSPKNFDFVRSLGADHIFDYKDSDVVSKIKSATPDIKYVFDTIGNDSSSGIAGQVVEDNDGVLCTVRPGKMKTEKVPKKVKVTDVLVFTAFLKEHSYAGKFHWPVKQDDHNLVTDFYNQVPAWLEKGELKSNEPKVINEGLDGVEKGFQAYRDEQISAFKFVYKLE